MTRAGTYPLGNEAEMANMHYTHDNGHAGYSAPEGYYTPDAATPEGGSNPLRNLTNFTGAVVSLALVAGVAVWGYKLVIRDVSGIPVVRAAENAMRVRPEVPGGQLARNTGLAVNEVAGAGEASGPVDRVVLAPRPMELSDEDQPMTAKMVAPVQQPAPLDVASTLEADAPTLDVAVALQDGSVEDLVAQLTAGVPTIQAATPLQENVPIEASFTPPATTQIVTITGPGPVQSRRPQLRPETAPAVVVPASAPAAIETKDMDPSALPSGTRLVQLGAYKSEEIARAEWDKKIARYGEYLEGKGRVIQKAQSGGRTFYRLRAHGFADLSDARRFCSALVAEGADCIPVVTR